MSPEELSNLAGKYLAGKASPEERRILDQWYYEHPGEEWVAEIRADGEEDGEAMLEQRMLIRLQKEMSTRRIPMRTVLRVAAMVVLAAGVGVAVHYAGRVPEKAPVAATMQDVAPGCQKAILTLSDGSTVALDSNRTVAIGVQGAANVRQMKGGALAYEGVEHPATVVYNTLTVPKGGQYRLVLPDGSKVWLNAASSIRYPVSFPGADRTVDMTGEAYFEIAPDPHKPFVVKVGDKESIQVLGTHFNVHAYEDEDVIRTTLLEGKVSVTSGGKTVTLVPGEEADGAGVNPEADLEAAVAWKNGMFVFNGARITDIMRQVSRWYDVEVVYQGDVQEKSFTGQISRYAHVSEVLHQLELTKDIHFTINENKITVMP
jgi:ferric-dicitrate binding protein FerR (iron transport regulator)